MRCFWRDLLLSLMLGASGATAAPLVYHSPGDTGIRPTTPPHLPRATSVTLYLWLDPGPLPVSGDVCTDASGDASCAYDVRVESHGDARLLAYAPVDGPCEIGCKRTNTMLRVNRVPTQPLITRQKIGELTLDTSYPLGGVIEVTGVHSVGAARQRQDIAILPIAYVPEPGQLLLLLSGLAGLAALHRLRGSR